MTNGTNGMGVVPKDDAHLTALLAASPAYIEARRAGTALISTPAAAPQTNQLTGGSEEHHSNITPEMAARLAAPLPPEAIDQHPTKAYLSTIRTIFSIERLNQVFGLDGWTYRTEVIENDKPMVVVKVTLYACGIVREQFGGNDNADRGDAYKGAVTDALSKICSYLGIGMDVYKGHGPTKTNGGKRTKPAEEPKPEPKPAPVAVRNTKPWKTFGGMLDEFAKVRALLPDDFYRQILMDNGVRSPEEFKRGPKHLKSENEVIALACYRQLLKAAADAQALAQDPTTYEHYVATEGCPVDPEIANGLRAWGGRP